MKNTKPSSLWGGDGGVPIQASLNEGGGTEGDGGSILQESMIQNKSVFCIHSLSQRC